MTELTFVRDGKVQVAEEDGVLFTLQALPPAVALNRWVATVKRKGASRRLGHRAHPTKAAALKWFEEYRGQN